MKKPTRNQLKVEGSYIHDVVVNGPLVPKEAFDADIILARTLETMAQAVLKMASMKSGINATGISLTTQNSAEK